MAVINFYQYMQWTAVADNDPLPCSAMSLSELQHHHREEGGNEGQSPERVFTSERMDKQKPKGKKVKKKTRKGLPKNVIILCYFAVLFFFWCCCRKFFP